MMEIGEMETGLPSADLVILKLTKEHVPAVAKLEAELFSVPWSEKAFADTLGMEHVFFYTAFVAGRLAGYCGIYIAADEGEITNVAVAPQYRRRRIAQSLLQTVMDRARQNGVGRIFLEVRSRNDPAVRLYQKYGFETIGTRKNYYRYPQDDALVMMYENADIYTKQQ